jgi:hypothetical protein
LHEVSNVLIRFFVYKREDLVETAGMELVIVL